MRALFPGDRQQYAALVVSCLIVAAVLAWNIVARTWW